MGIRSMVAVLTLLFLVSNVHAGEENVSKEKVSLNPVQMILKPFSEGGLLDLIISPAERILTGVFELGEVAVTPSRTREHISNINKNVSVIVYSCFFICYPCHNTNPV